MTGIKRWFKVTVLEFQKNCYIAQNGINFGPKINTSEHFSNSVHLIFLKLFLMTGIKKWFKVTDLDFEGKFMLFSKQGKWVKYWNQGRIFTFTC